MRKISTALGCDGVLADFHTGVLRIIEEVTGRKFDTSTITITEGDFTTALGLSDHEVITIHEALKTRRGFAASLPRYPQARQGVRRLSTLGKVFCITTPWDSNSWWRAERESWLALHFGIDHVHHSDNDDKTPYEADIFVDDDGEHVSKWQTAWPGRTVVLWRTPQNRGEPIPRGVHATGSWEELYQIAREVARGPVHQPQPPMEPPAEMETP